MKHEIYFMPSCHCFYLGWACNSYRWFFHFYLAGVLVNTYVVYNTAGVYLLNQQPNPSLQKLVTLIRSDAVSIGQCLLMSRHAARVYKQSSDKVEAWSCWCAVWLQMQGRPLSWCWCCYFKPADVWWSVCSSASSPSQLWMWPIMHWVYSSTLLSHSVCYQKHQTGTLTEVCICLCCQFHLTLVTKWKFEACAILTSSFSAWWRVCRVHEVAPPGRTGPISLGQLASAPYQQGPCSATD